MSEEHPRLWKPDSACREREGGSQPSQGTPALPGGFGFIVLRARE